MGIGLIDRESLLQLSRYVVTDAYFAIHDFAKGLTDAGFHLVSQFRSDVALMYLHDGPRTGKKGIPKKYGGKIDVKNLDMDKFKQVRDLKDDGEFYTTIAYLKSLKRNVRLVVFQPAEGKPILYFSTDTGMKAKDVVDYYRTRFPIEFCFRDGKQFSGLCDCQVRNFAALDFAFNASLSSINVAKIVIKDYYPTFSVANLKSLLYNAYITNRFFAMSHFRPNKSIIARIFKELLNIAAPVA